MFFKERKVTFDFEISLDHWAHMLMSLHLLKQREYYLLYSFWNSKYFYKNGDQELGY